LIFKEIIRMGACSGSKVLPFVRSMRAVIPVF
jgi:hypothetical protein